MSCAGAPAPSSMAWSPCRCGCRVVKPRVHPARAWWNPGFTTFGGAGGSGSPEGELVGGDGDVHLVTVVEGAVEEQDREPVAQVALQDAAERAGAVVGVVAARGQPR